MSAINLNHCSRLALAACTVALLSACSTAEPPSGFLGDPSVYAMLQPHPELSNVKVLRKSDKPLAAYDKFILPPVKIYLNATGQKREIAPEDLSELAQYFRNQVFLAIDDAYPITNIPGPNVAVLRLAISDADPNIPLLNIHPGTLVVGQGLGGATVELELIDSVSGERVVAATASIKGKRYEYIAGLSKWGHTESVMNDWAEMIRKRLDEDHNRAE